MANTDPYLVADIKAWAIIKGVKFDDVVSVSATFALNTIPTASVVLAVGFNPVTQKFATIHKEKENIEARDPIQIYAKITTKDGRTDLLKDGTYKIFEGYVAGIGYQRSHNHANYIINAVHWLDDLNNSSAINGNWMPGAPFDYAEQAVFDVVGPNGTVSSISGKPGVAHFGQTEKLQSDVWKDSLKPLLEWITGLSTEQLKDGPGAGGAVKMSNKAAKDALDKMPGDGKGAAYYKPLAMDVNAENGGANLGKSVGDFYEMTINTSFAQNSMWAKIVGEFAPQFMFAISPAVDWALPIPFCGGVKTTAAQKIITAKEYNYANFNANMSQLLESVNVYYPTSSPTNVPNLAMDVDGTLSYYKPWGAWPPEGLAKKGLKLFKLPPAWAVNLDPGSLAAGQSGVNATDGVTPPLPGARRMPEKVKPPAEAHKAVEPLVEKFAKHWYLTEVLQQRYGEFSGPLRFDIAPGSIIRIETPPFENTAAGANSNPYMAAAVISVSYVINSERATAGTSFSIGHIKTKKEESRDGLYAIDKPPLYKQTFYHGPLADPS